jgi:hypothetical protein
MQSESRACQNFHHESEALVNHHVNLELRAGHVYSAMVRTEEEVGKNDDN